MAAVGKIYSFICANLYIICMQVRLAVITTMLRVFRLHIICKCSFYSSLAFHQLNSVSVNVLFSEIIAKDTSKNHDNTTASTTANNG